MTDSLKQMFKPTVIAVVSNKGGVAKSTTSAALMSFLSEKDQTICLSLDSQGDIETILSVDVPDDFPTIADQLIDENPGWSAYSVHPYKLAYITPSDLRLEVLPEKLKAKGVDFIKRFCEKTSSVNGWEYPYVVIDCPPSLNVFTQAAITAADYVIIPMWPVTLNIKGACAAIQYANLIASSQSLPSKVLGILFTLDEHYNLNEETKRKVEDIFPGLPFKQTIRRTVKMEESIGRGLLNPLSSNKAVQDYKAFVDEVIERINHRNHE